MVFGGQLDLGVCVHTRDDYLHAPWRQTHEKDRDSGTHRQRHRQGSVRLLSSGPSMRLDDTLDGE